MFSKLSFFLVLTFSFLAQAQEFKVMVNNKYDKKSVKIPQLKGKSVFADEYFKIVHKKDNTPISINTSNKKLKLKAANVFYHLHLARTYFQNLMKEEFPEDIKPITIRLDFSDGKNKSRRPKTQFAPKSKPEFNTAISILPSHKINKIKNTEGNKGYQTWGYEIWFRPAKLNFQKSSSNQAVNQGLQIYDILKSSSHYIDLLSIVKKLIENNKDDIEKDIANLIEKYAKDQVARFALKVLLEQINYGIKYLDSALNNEIIYHEYTHIILSRYISIRGPLTLGEGLANFYATQISKGKNIAARLSFHSFIKGKKAETDLKYTHEIETEEMAQEDFTYSLLYQMAKILKGGLREKITPANYVLDVVKTFDSKKRSPRLYPDFTDKMVRKCSKLCLDSFTTKIELNHLLYLLDVQ